MPKIEWDERSMKYALCFFPLIGCVIGGIIYFIGNLLLQIKIGNILFASIMSIIPLAITGGIHFDGFLDTLDAINSYADKKKRLEILKDPNAGAFAVIGGLIYFTLSIGFWSEVHENMLLNISFSYILSRAFSGLSVVTFPFAKNNGLAVTFGKNADKIKVRVVMIIFIIVSTAFSLYINLIGG